jgi:ABC-type nitrate/sulfonate/bicarbonate transport system substrate-binding protein
MPKALFKNAFMLGLGTAALAAACGIDQAAAQPCPAMRKINIAVSVAPPNVVHTSPYVAKALGFFEKRCIDATIVQFEGGQSATSAVAAAQGSAITSVSDVSIGRGLKVQQIWGLAPRMPQAYMVPGEVKTAADLKGKRLSATGGGVGGFNWRMGREVLKSAKLDVGDAQFIPSPTAGRLPGLIAGQIDGVALHPEDVFLARKQKDSLHPLVQLVELMPLYMFNAYGASTEWIAKDRALLRDTVAAMIEANRAIYRERDKVVPIIVDATKKPKEAVEFAIESNVKNCIWSVNSGFSPQRTQWSIDNSVENGDIEAGKKPTVEQVANMKLAEEAVELVGGKVTIGNCTE